MLRYEVSAPLLMLAMLTLSPTEMEIVFVSAVSSVSGM